MSLQFGIPISLGTEQFIAKFSRQANVQLVSRQKIRATFYDSFDWRLYSKGITGEFIRAKPAASFQLKSLENGAVIAQAKLTEVPAFSKDFKPGQIRRILEPILEMRALLPICTCDYQMYHFDILNKDAKTILRMVIEQYDQFDNRVTLHPIKGYGKAVEYIVEILTTKLGLTAVDKSILTTVLKHQGRTPQDYSSKLNIHLEPDLRADIAVKAIFSHLLKTIKANEQGTLADTDSEFLHDFRVAVRRTRTGLSQLSEVLPEKITAHFVDFFSWLGQITGPTRDLDVYLLNFDHYKKSLPVSIREDINPLYEFLLTKKQKAQHELASKLRSQKYRSTLAEWESYLKGPAPPTTHMTIKELANLRIWKNNKRILRQGSALTNLSCAEKFHELRKTCKKMRYLIEFFQSLYPENQMKSFIKSLKELQDVLGDYQDFEVQECNLKKFSIEMLADNIPVNSLLAMGVLIQNLDAGKCRARKHFESRFEAYKMTEKQLVLKALLASHL